MLIRIGSLALLDARSAKLLFYPFMFGLVATTLFNHFHFGIIGAHHSTGPGIHLAEIRQCGSLTGRRRQAVLKARQLGLLGKEDR